MRMLIDTLNARPKLEQTQFAIDGQGCEVNHRHIADDVVFLHFTMPEADVGEALAPEGTEFAEREIAVGFRNDMPGFVVAGHARHTTVEKALQGLLAMDYGSDVANRLVLSSRANEDEIQRLLEEGIEYVDLGLAPPFVEADQVVGEQPTTISTSILNAIASALSTRLHADHSEDAIREMPGLNSLPATDIH